MTTATVNEFLTKYNNGSEDIVSNCNIAKNLIQHLPENEHELENDPENGDIEVSVTLLKKDACELMVRCMDVLNISVVQKILSAIPEEDLTVPNIPGNETITIVFTKENIKSTILMLIKDVATKMQ